MKNLCLFLAIFYLVASMALYSTPARANGVPHEGLSAQDWSAIQQRLGATKSISQTKELLSSDGAAGDAFAWSVAISGDTAVVGARWDDDTGDRSGAAYLFERHAGGTDNWGEIKKLLGADTTAGDFFGGAVALDGNTVVVTSQYNGGIGAAYVFDRDAGGADSWGQVAKLTASDAAFGDQFGASVSISGDTVVVGSIFDDDAGSQSGSAYVYERDFGGADNWGQVKKLVASDAAMDDLFHAVAIHGDTLVVGAPGNDDNAAESGSAYIFERHFGGTDNWGEVKKLNAADATTIDRLGQQVAIDGDTVLISAGTDDDAGAGAGAAYIFERHAGGTDNWGEVKKLLGADTTAGDQFGVYSVGISGDRVVVGAVYDDTLGSAYVFERHAGGTDNWGEVQKLTLTGGVAGDAFGFTAISGGTILIGAPNRDDAGTDSGAAYIYEAPSSVDLAVSVAESADPVIAGSAPGQLTYTVALSNGGSSDATGVELGLDLTLPAGVAVDSITPSDGSFATTTAPDGTWTVGGLSSGASSTLTVVLTASAGAAAGTGVIECTASVSAVVESDSDPLNDSDSASTSIERVTELSITKTDGLISAIPGQDVTYLIGVTNAGPSDAMGAAVVDTFAAELTDCQWTCAGTGGASCTAAGSGDIADAADIPAGESVTYTATCTVDVGAAGTLANTATVTADAGAGDSNAGDDSATDGDTQLRPAVYFDELTHAAEGETVDVPLQLASAGLSIASLVLSIDFDESCLDPDVDDDGTLDSVTSHLPADFTLISSYDPLDTDGEIEVSIADLAPPLAALPDGALLTVNYAVTCDAVPVTPVDAAMAFSLDPAASFGDTSSGDVDGSQVDGLVRVWPGPRGDCNGGETLGAADLTAVGEEIFDGDGSTWYDADQPTFVGSPVGCDANASGEIAAGDVTCVNELLFGRDCGGTSDFEIAQGAPRLEISMAAENGIVWIRAALEPNGHAVGSLAFSLDLDPQLWPLAAIDADGDGQPDLLRFPAGRPGLAWMRLDPNDEDGELDILLANLERVAFSQGIQVEIGVPTEILPQGGLRFSKEPAASFGSIDGEEIDGVALVDGQQIFSDGFESGDTSAWAGTF